MDQTSTMGKWMEEQAARAPQRGLQLLLIQLFDRMDEVIQRRGVTWPTVGAIAGFDDDWLEKLLNDPSSVTVGTLVAIANVLDIELDIVFLPKEM